MLICAMFVLVLVFAMGVYFGKTLAKSESELAALSLQNQVENTMPDVPDEDIKVTSKDDDTTVETDEDGFVKIMIPSQTPTPEPGETFPDVTEISPAPAQTPAPTPEPTPLPPAPSEGKFTIQLSSHPSKTEAEAAMAKYTAKGVSAVYIVSFSKGPETWFRVRTGAYATKSAAKQVAEAIKAKGIVASPWVTTK